MREKRGDQPTIYTKPAGFPMTSGAGVAQIRKRTYHNRQVPHAARAGKKKNKEKRLAHGEGRTRSLQIARVR